MNQRKTFIVGVIFLLLGCITSLYLALIITNARIKGIFYTMASDSPTNQFKHFQCPLLLSKNETASVFATISNPTSDSLHYFVHIEAYGFSTRSPNKELEVIVPGGYNTEVTWVVTAIESGNRAIAIEAVSNKDSALPGPFHMWPTSFREGCGILVINGPFTGKQVLLLSLSSVFVGAVMSFPRLYTKIRERIKRKQSD
ncbi:MAG: hypothetical protein OEW09_15805 [Anaerolineae bacterium]|nr:hypothetical protein [Anaerolineae bacterium]